MSDSEDEYFEEPGTKILKFLDHGKIQSISFSTQNVNESDLVKCDHCDKYFTKDAIDSHILTHLNKSVDSNQCLDCEHVFDSATDLLNHQRLMKINTRWQ